MADRPNIYFICVHKGASTFVAGHLLPSVAGKCPDYSTYLIGKKFVEWFHEQREQLGMQPTLDRDMHERRMLQMFADDPLPPSNCLVGRLYPDYVSAISTHLKTPFPPAGSKVFLMRRDPRDALVSMYYSLAFSHGESALLVGRASAQLEERRREIQKIGVYRWIADTLSEPDSRHILDEFESCASLLRECPQIVDLPYEQLIADPRSWLDSFVDHAELNDVVDPAWYDRMLSQLIPPESDDVNKHKRRMKPGNWKEVFDEQLALLLNERVGEQMEQLAYPWYE